MKFITKSLLTSVAVLLASYILKGVSVDSTLTAVIVAIVLGLLNTFIKPILFVLTIPITVFTLGLFLLVINIIIVFLASKIVPGFVVESWGWALMFSFIVSITSSVLEKLVNKYTKPEEKIQEF